MKSQENTGIYVAILLALIFVFGFVCGVLAESAKKSAGKYECEQNLPRSQQCVIKWVSEEKK